MIGSWSNRIIEESCCHMQDRHPHDAFKPDVNYVALGLEPGQDAGRTTVEAVVAELGAVVLQ